MTTHHPHLPFGVWVVGRGHGGRQRALPAIYDAALSDEHWPRALALLSAEVPAIGAFLIAVDQLGLPFMIREAASTYRPEDLEEEVFGEARS